MRKLRVLAVLLLVAALAGSALALDWPVIPAPPPGPGFTASGGDWNTAGTWAGNTVPGDGAIVTIPQGVTVTLAGTTARLRWVQVEGNLALSSTASSQMFVDTLRIATHGTFTLTSLPWNLTAQVTFISGAPIDATWDTQQITRGLIGEGRVTLMGLPKTNMATVTGDLFQGQNLINLDAVPTNWQVNDYVVVTGTHFRRYAKMQDEKRRISFINGTIITLDQPLAYDHRQTSTTNSASLTITPPLHVANLTRNVVFSSESTTNTYDRGHVLIGHEDSNIQNVAFVNLGRTDKSKILDDYIVNRDATSPFTAINLVKQTDPTKITNMRGRYPLHVFDTVDNPLHGGAENIPHLTVIQGCVVEGSIGWGFVNRRSNVDFRRNVAYNFIGAGFVAEGGDELGDFIRNIAIHGIGQIWADADSRYRGDNRYRKIRLNFMNLTRPQPLADIAFNGDGFWFAGPALTVNGDVANSCNGSGMMWHPTGIVDVSTALDSPPFGRYTYFPKAWISAIYPNLPANFAPRNWTHGADEILTGDLPILNSVNIDSYANFVGFRLRFANFDNIDWYNEAPFRYDLQINPVVPGDLRAMPTRQRESVSNLNLWNNEAAITLRYVSFTDWTDITGISRLDYDENHPEADPGISANYGIETFFIVTNMNWTRLTLDGYELAYWTADGTNCSAVGTSCASQFTFTQEQNRNDANAGLQNAHAVCSSPGVPSTSSDGSGGAFITWGPAAGTPSSYLVRYRGLGDQQWSFPSPISVSTRSIHILGLDPGRAYQVQVDSGCSNGVSPWVTGIPFNAPCGPPEIEMPPVDATVASGQLATLAVAAGGNEPFSYQWYEGTAPSTDVPVGSNDHVLSVAPVATTSYWVNVTNACGTAATATATVIVCDPPAITTQPQSQTVIAGSLATLSVTAGGNGPFSYQWYQGEGPSTALPVGTNSSSLLVAPSSTTSYWVSVANGCGSTASITVTVSVCNPPGIVVQPFSQTIPAGSATTLSVVAGGTGPFTYQWYQGPSGTTTSPVGRDSTSLTVAPPVTTSYWVAVTNACGGASSITATVTICNAPGIVTQPSSQTITLGSSATLTVTASGVSPFTYQWYQGQSGVTTMPVGTNSNSLTISPPTTTSYWVRVSNFCAPTSSNTATITVCGPPAITTQPASQTVSSGSSVTLVVAASGSGTFSYQWYAGTSGTTATPVGTNSNTFITPLLTAGNSYWVRVTSTCLGTYTVDSATATITVVVQIARRQLVGTNANSQPTITASWSQPTLAGSLLTAVISASDVAQIGAFTPPAGWQLASANSYSNIKTSIYYYPNNPGGRTAETFHLTNYPDSTLDLIEYTGAMTTSPLDQTALDEGSAPIGMVVVDTGTTPPINKPREVVLTALTTYAQTSFTTPTDSFVKIDEQSVLYHLTTAVHEKIVATTGSYGHSANVGGNAQWVGLVVTFMATDCMTAPIISAQPASTTVPAGQSATLAVTAAGSGLNYQWYQGAAPSTASPIGGNSPRLTVAPSATTSYWVNVFNPCGSTPTSTATVTVCAPPSITVQPQSQAVASGSPATLTVTAGGAGPFTYQWYQGASGTTTTPIGTNSSSLTVTPSATTSYWVKVSNTCGPVSSNTATIIVCTTPGIVTQPASQSVSSGSSASLSVTAGGSGPFSYQWYQGVSGTTTNPVGGNSSTFTTPALTATTSYWVRVTSTCSGSASASSATATLTVTAPAQIARRQLAAGNANSMSSLTVHWTQSTQTCSLLVAVLSASDSNPIGAFTPPAGWQLANSYSFSNIKTSIYYYPNNPGGRTVETFSLTNYPDSTLDLIEYTGVMAASPLDKTGFDGNWTPSNGIVTSGTTQTTAQSKEVVVTALTTWAQTSFTSPTNGFVKIDEQAVLYHLTTAVHERIVTTAGTWGHAAMAGGNASWVGLVVTFRSADTTP